MHIIMYIFSVIQLFFAVSMLGAAQSAMHETTAAIAFAGGSICFGIGFLIKLKHEQAEREAALKKTLNRMCDTLEENTGQKD